MCAALSAMITIPQLLAAPAAAMPMPPCVTSYHFRPALPCVPATMQHAAPCVSAHARARRAANNSS
eukprot:14334805-Alexandrium_andersonii.AAC.1